MLLKKCPLKYPLTQCLVSVMPQKLVTSTAEAHKKFEKVLKILLYGKWRFAEDCDEIFAQYKAFIIEVKKKHLSEFLDFSITENRLDAFYWNYLKDHKYAKLWDVFVMIFTLSHGQAAVERDSL